MITSNTKILISLFFSLFVDLACAQAATPTLQQGEQIYAVTCATGYCHTLKGGVGGGAPRLAARDFDLNYITQTVSFGLHDTRMQGFAASLSADQLEL